MSDRVAVEGRNCWRRVSAGRVSFLIDAAAYFEALAAAFDRATHSILVMGWDVNSSVRLRGRGEETGKEERLAPLLADLVGRRRSLRVHVVLWDFAMIYALEREVLPVLRLGWSTPRRIDITLDDEHPVGASRHQKIVVVDDAVAFSGGIDITGSRWDTPEHLPDDPRRVDPWGGAYGPFHDAQIAVDGEAARALGTLVRQRWEQLTGKTLDAPPGDVADRWPDGLAPDVRDVTVALARTEPAWKGQAGAREVVDLHLASIAAARECIYLENQYFTAGRIGEALAARLQEEDGPEVVMVGPRRCSGWLEDVTMGVLRARLLERLRRADAHGRLHAYHPMASVERDVAVHVHSKVTIVDDALARVGSANLSNRSMGFDAECDVALEAEGRADVARAIAALRHRLVGEHLGVDAARVAEAESETGSLAAAIERLRGGDRTLVPLELEETDVELGSAVNLADPERPVDAETLRRQLLAEEVVQIRRHPAKRAAAVLAPLLLLAALWQFTDLGEHVDPGRLVDAASPLRQSDWAPVAAAGAFVVAAVLMVPVMALVVAAGLLFGPWKGAAVALVGSLASAILGYRVGRVLWRDAVRRLGGKNLNRVSRALAQQGILAVATVRLVPVAPFTVVNLIAGSSHVRARDFVLGTLVGMTPGILALTVFADRAVAAVRDPGIGTFMALAAVALVALAGLRWLHGRTRAGAEDGREEKRREDDGEGAA